LLALLLHRLDEQRVLVAEVAVQRQLGHARFGGQGIHADPVETVQREQPLGGGEDGGALLRVLGTAGAAGTALGGGIGRHGEALDNYWTGEFYYYTVLVSSLSCAPSRSCPCVPLPSPTVPPAAAWP